jgi:hypothetical protein
VDHPCETCTEREAWWPYAQCVRCIRLRVLPASQDVGEVPLVHFRVTTLAAENSKAFSAIERKRSIWEFQHPGWRLRFFSAYRDNLKPTKSEPFGRYWHEARYTVHRIRYPKSHDPWAFYTMPLAANSMPNEWVVGYDAARPVLQEAFRED